MNNASDIGGVASPTMTKHEIAARLWARGEREAYTAFMYYVKQDDLIAQNLRSMIVAFVEPTR
jgi:hypothetical protein